MPPLPPALDVSFCGSEIRSCQAAQKCHASPTVCDLCSHELLRVWVLWWVRRGRAPKARALFGYWAWTVRRGMGVGSPVPSSRKVQSLERQPFKYRKSQAAFMFPVIVSWNSIFSFSLNVEFQLLFVYDSLSGIFQYFLITVYCISPLHWLLFFVSVEVLFYPEK